MEKNDKSIITSGNISSLFSAVRRRQKVSKTSLELNIVNHLILTEIECFTCNIKMHILSNYIWNGYKDIA